VLSLPSVASLSIIIFFGLCLTAAIGDARRLIIPNRISFSIALLYPAFVIAGGLTVDWPGALIVATFVLAAGFSAYSCGFLGAGDAKMLAAASLRAGPGLIAPFLFDTALAGGAMALGMWGLHRWRRAASLSDVLTVGPASGFERTPMPYGVAIAVGALFVASTLLGGA
jgi:prepilin peptidase CpaA